MLIATYPHIIFRIYLFSYIKFSLYFKIKIKFWTYWAIKVKLNQMLYILRNVKSNKDKIPTRIAGPEPTSSLFMNEMVAHLKWISVWSLFHIHFTILFAFNKFSIVCANSVAAFWYSSYPCLADWVFRQNCTKKGKISTDKK